MMMNHTSKNQCKYPPGTVITGKWHNLHYKLIKELGSGANGVVYLVEGKNGYKALKISTDSVSITSEVNVLKALEKVQGSTLGPSLYDVDDWERRNGIVHFYVMEYVKGPNLLSFVSMRGSTWAGIMIVQLLDVLENLHKKGWVFGDLKPENLIVTGPPPQIRMIDVGGITKQDRAIKEFTEFFDRGYWGLGSRKAEPSYDLFSTAMMMINFFYPNRMIKKSDGYRQLSEIIQLKKELVPFESVLKKALRSEYQSAIEMKRELLLVLSEGEKRPVKSEATRYNTRRKKKKRLSSLLETMSILILTVLLYALYIYGYIL